MSKINVMDLADGRGEIITCAIKDEMVRVVMTDPTGDSAAVEMTVIEIIEHATRLSNLVADFGYEFDSVSVDVNSLSAGDKSRVYAMGDDGCKFWQEWVASYCLAESCDVATATDIFFRYTKPIARRRDRGRGAQELARWIADIRVEAGDNG